MRKELYYHIQNWRKDRTTAHEQGESPEPLELEIRGVKYPEAEEQELVLWEDLRRPSEPIPMSQELFDKAYPKSIIQIWEEGPNEDI